MVTKFGQEEQGISGHRVSAGTGEWRALHSVGNVLNVAESPG